MSEIKGGSSPITASFCGAGEIFLLRYTLHNKLFVKIVHSCFNTPFFQKPAIKLVLWFLNRYLSETFN
jgi:hypothetical protein